MHIQTVLKKYSTALAVSAIFTAGHVFGSFFCSPGEALFEATREGDLGEVT